jgi:hypothetical protein
LVASDQAAVGFTPQAAVMALLDSPRGPKLRFGIVDNDDTRRWQAADRGSTAQLDARGIRTLRQLLGEVSTEHGPWLVRDYEDRARQTQAEFDAAAAPLRARIDALQQMTVGEWRDGSAPFVPLPADRQAELDQLRAQVNEMEDRAPWPDWEQESLEGVIHGEWADIVWRVTLAEELGTVRGTTDQAKVSWDFDLAVRPHNAGPDWDPYGWEQYLLMQEAAEVEQLARKVEQLAAQAPAGTLESTARATLPAVHRRGPRRGKPRRRANAPAAAGPA